MKLAHRVALDGKQLDAVDSRINIKAIEEGAGKETIGAVSAAAGWGQRITNRRRDTLEVTVKFSLLIGPDELEERSELLEKVNAWAAPGGSLSIGYRPNRRLNVVCVQAPGAGDQYEWTTVYAITFRAYALPYWEERVANEMSTKTAKDASLTMNVAGSAETDADITLVNKSGAAIQNVTITGGGKSITFASLALAGGEQLKIRHIYRNGLRILQCVIINTADKARSVMAKRTPESADDIVFSPGDVAFSFSADRACQMTVSVRGRFV